MSASIHRRRLVSAALVPAIVVAGLLSRRSEWVHAAFGKYPGDALWTAMIYCLVVALGPGLSRVSVAAVALPVSFAVEFSQLLRHPWLDSVRGTALGHRVLEHLQRPGPRRLRGRGVGRLRRGLAALPFEAIPVALRSDPWPTERRTAAVGSSPEIV